MYEKLQAYKRENNTCNVPKRYQSDPKLGHWVHYQRTMCKAKKLSQERKDLLESIGFVWSERQTSKTSREQTSWDERFEELKKFQSIHGHCKVPRTGKDAALGRWVKWQRWNRTLLDRGESSVLTKRMIKLLNSVGFSWGYQRVPPQKKTSNVSASDMSIEPLPYMPSESSSSSSTDHEERKHVVSPPFPAPRDDRSSFSSRFSESNSYLNQGSNTNAFNHNQVSFNRPSMSPLEEDYDTFSRHDTSSSNSVYDLPSRFQQGGHIMDRMPSNNFRGMQRPNNFPPMMEDPFKFNSNQINSGRHIAVSKVWKCSVCRYASFDTYDDALTHENRCNGFPEDANFCRACAA